jgi:hypothetical protein
MRPNHRPDTDTQMFDCDLAPSDAPGSSIDLQSQMQPADRLGALPVSYRHDDSIQDRAAQDRAARDCAAQDCAAQDCAAQDRAARDCAARVRQLEPALSGTTPTRLPDLLRAVSLQAGRLADDPFNALDNNPFIVREWLIVSQVLHAAATSLEKRFDALFQEI